MMELARLGEVVRVPGEVPEWGELVKGEWAAPESVQVREESVYVRNAEGPLLMKPEYRAT
jgi:hypothetical protein